MESEVKIYGLYCPTDEDKTNIDTATEYDLWKTISNLSDALSWAWNGAIYGGEPKLPIDEITRLGYTLNYAIYSTKRFGVEFDSEPTAKQEITLSTTYIAWHTFWKRHFDSMKPDVYNSFLVARDNGGDVSMFLPKNTWRDALEELGTRT